LYSSTSCKKDEQHTGERKHQKRFGVSGSVGISGDGGSSGSSGSVVVAVSQ
tara:strand:- start:48 stop:200 length:153 start_codon:yes stop_codon:yes gene_type:complete